MILHPLRFVELRAARVNPSSCLGLSRLTRFEINTGKVMLVNHLEVLRNRCCV